MIRRLACCLLVPALLGGGVLAAGGDPPVDQVGIDQHLDRKVTLDLEFVDETGRRVALGDYFGDKPVVLSLAYYRCPMLCTLVLNGMAKTLAVLGLGVGDDFQVVTVSIDPRETPEQAAEARVGYLERLGRPEAERGWHFLTGRQDEIERLAGEVGFRYVYDEETDQYAHASGIIVLTPDGRIARYFYGIEYAPRDLRFALVEASEGRIGSVVDQILLLCYQYDPATGTYGVIIYRVLRIAGIVTVLLMGLFVILMLRRDARLAHRRTV